MAIERSKEHTEKQDSVHGDKDHRIITQSGSIAISLGRRCRSSPAADDPTLGERFEEELYRS